MDKERQVYKLKEASLGEVIAKSFGIQKATELHDKLVGWQKRGGGVFADTVQDVRATRGARCTVAR